MNSMATFLIITGFICALALKDLISCYINLKRIEKNFRSTFSNLNNLFDAEEEFIRLKHVNIFLFVVFIVSLFIWLL